MDNVLTVGLHGLLIDGLEDLTLYVVLQLLSCVTPVRHTENGRFIAHVVNLSHKRVVPLQNYLLAAHVLTETEYKNESKFDQNHVILKEDVLF